MREEELKFTVHGLFELPDLAPALPDGGEVLPRPHRELRATYYDTTEQITNMQLGEFSQSKHNIGPTPQNRK